MSRTIAALTALLAISLATPESGRAQQPGGAPDSTIEDRHSINLGTSALAGHLSVNYEYLRGAHGLVIEGSAGRMTPFDFEAAVGYRWHWSGTQDSWFLGGGVAYLPETRRVHLVELSDDDAFGGRSEAVDRFEAILGLTANIGHRWAWDNGFNITWRMGLRYPLEIYRHHGEPTTLGDHYARPFRCGNEDWDLGLGDALATITDTELSIGFTF